MRLERNAYFACDRVAIDIGVATCAQEVYRLGWAGRETPSYLRTPNHQAPPKKPDFDRGLRVHLATGPGRQVLTRPTPAPFAGMLESLFAGRVKSGLKRLDKVGGKW